MIVTIALLMLVAYVLGLTTMGILAGLALRFANRRADESRGNEPRSRGRR